MRCCCEHNTRFGAAFKWKCCWRRRWFGWQVIHTEKRAAVISTVANNFNKKKLVKTLSRLFSLHFWWWNANGKLWRILYKLFYVYIVNPAPLSTSLRPIYKLHFFHKTFLCFWPLFGWEVAGVSILSFGNLFIMKKASLILVALFAKFKKFFD